MNSSRPADSLPSTARAIALLLSSTPGVQDAQPNVLHQLLEFSHRYALQVLTDASVYAEHAGRPSKIDMDDVVLAIQARVGWEFGGRVPKEYLLSLASEVNAAPLPAVPEVFGVRLPPNSDCLTSVDFDLIPNKPPPGVKIYDEEVEEIEESESSEEEFEEPEPPQSGTSVGWNRANGTPSSVSQQDHIMDTPFPISAIATPSDVDMLGPSAGSRMEADEGSEVDEEGLFGGGDDDEEESDGMEEVQTGSAPANGVKRKLVEEDDYD